MTHSALLGVPYHQQDTSYYCGAACAQMVLASINGGILLDQDDLYADNHSHSTAESGWYSGPDGLQWTMNNRRPSGFGNYFALFALPNEDSISRKIIWTIHHYQVAPIALVYGSDHWIVVHGYTASDAPSGAGDLSFAIESFDINNPWPPVPGGGDPGVLPPPHGVSDGCGTGGNRGIANEHLAYSAWQDDYMTGVPGGHWAGKHVAVCDPEPPSDRIGRAPEPPPPMLPDGRLLEPRDAADIAVKSLQSHRLDERKGIRALGRADPSEPVLVQRLDRPESFYMIVPFRSDGANVPLAVAIDARTGQYRQSVFSDDPQSSAVYWSDPDLALRSVVDTKVDLGEPLGRVRLRRDAVCVYPHLVWRPCRESLSPFYPFHMMTLGSHRVFIRVDGAVFGRLTDAGRGI